MSFQEWLDMYYYPGFDPSGLSDEEYAELEYEYYADLDELQSEDEEEYD